MHDLYDEYETAPVIGRIGRIYLVPSFPLIKWARMDKVILGFLEGKVSSSHLACHLKAEGYVPETNTDWTIGQTLRHGCQDG
jgi:hypothetical protein